MQENEKTIDETIRENRLREGQTRLLIPLSCDRSKAIPDKVPPFLVVVVE